MLMRKLRFRQFFYLKTFSISVYFMILLITNIIGGIGQNLLITGASNILNMSSLLASCSTDMGKDAAHLPKAVNKTNKMQQTQVVH